MVKQKLSALQVNRLDLDEAMELASQANGLRGFYQTKQLASPEWLDDGIRTLDRFITDNTRDAAEARLRELEQEELTDRTKDERRAARQAEKDALLKKLGREVTA